MNEKKRAVLRAAGHIDGLLPAGDVGGRLVMAALAQDAINQEYGRSTPGQPKFSALALGAKFRYAGDSRIWVKIGANRIAKWDPGNVSNNWVGQQICAFASEGEEPEIELAERRLYVWEDVLSDYTSGMIVALARSEHEAVEAVRIRCGNDAAEEARVNEPEVFEVAGSDAVVREVHGGG